MVETYTELGYEVIDLPRVDGATRVEFVTARITSMTTLLGLDSEFPCGCSEQLRSAGIGTFQGWA